MNYHAVVLTAALTLGSLTETLLAQGRKLDEAARRACERVANDYIEWDSDGGQLTPEGWRRIAALFTEPGSPRTDRIGVHRSIDIAVDREIQSNGVVLARVWLVHLGTLDLNGPSFSDDGVPGGIKTIGDLTFVPIGGPAGPSCKIKGPVPLMSISVPAAIRVVTARRDKATSAKERRRANYTIASLKLQQEPAARGGQ